MSCRVSHPIALLSSTCTNSSFLLLTRPHLPTLFCPSLVLPSTITFFSHLHPPPFSTCSPQPNPRSLTFILDQYPCHLDRDPVLRPHPFFSASFLSPLTFPVPPDPVLKKKKMSYRHMTSTNDLNKFSLKTTGSFIS